MSAEESARASGRSLNVGDANSRQGLDGHANNFNLIRLLAAWAVIVGHSFPLTGTPYPRLNGTGISFGSVAVDLFFLTSGYLVTKSLVVRQDLGQFILARILRIYPGLIVLTLVTVLIAAAFSGPGFLTNPRTLDYVAKTAFVSTQLLTVFDLPGVFTSNPYPNAVNGSLWTLPWEMRMYVVLAALWAATWLLKWPRARVMKVAVVAVAVIGAAAKVARPESWAANFVFMFFAGATYYALRRHIKLNGVVACACVVALFLASLYKPAFLLVYNLTLGYILFAAAFIPTLWRPKHDYSYGAYIYAFPIQQCIALLFPAVGWGVMVLLATPVTLMAAALSWHLVEKPMVGLKRYRPRAFLVA